MFASTTVYRPSSFQTYSDRCFEEWIPVKRVYYHGPARTNNQGAAMADSELRIPTKELTVELTLLGGVGTTVALHLAEHEQNLIDRLEEDQPFLPVRETGGSDWSIINKNGLLWASIVLVDGRLPIDVDVEEAPLFDRQVEVRVDFVQGDPLHGKILYSPPAGQTRVTDHINRPDLFFRLWTSDHLFIVNKAHVLRIIEIEDETAR